MTDRAERLLLIDRLARENAESRAEIERRQAELAADPCGFDLVKLADRRVTGDAGDLCYGDVVETPFLRKTGPGGMRYMRGPENERAPVSEALTTPPLNETEDADAGWNRWFSASFVNHIDVERDAEREVISRALGAILAKRDRRTKKLERRIEALERQIETLVTKTGADVHVLRKVHNE